MKKGELAPYLLKTMTNLALQETPGTYHAISLWEVFWFRLNIAIMLCYLGGAVLTEVLQCLHRCFMLTPTIIKMMASKIPTRLGQQTILIINFWPTIKHCAICITTEQTLVPWSVWFIIWFHYYVNLTKLHHAITLIFFSFHAFS